jgi:CBS domain containing-hemolysin-like protein
MELLIFYVVLALGVSFICSVLEAVLLSVTPGFIHTEVSSGKKYAIHLAKMKENVDNPLSAILTLNTIAHTMGAAGAGAQWKAIYGDTG